MGQVAYKLGLLQIESPPSFSCFVPLVGTEGNIILEPVAVLGRRLIKRNSQPVHIKL